MLGPWLLGKRGPGAFVGSAGEGDPGFEEPPTVIDVNGDVTIHGKVKPGSFGKFVYPLAAVATGRKYTFRAVANFSQLAQQGKLAMVGFGFKSGNDFHLTGLRGDGSTGTDEYIVHGTPPNGWNKQTGHTEINEGDAGAGTQHSAYYQLTTSSDGSTYTLKTSTDGVAYTTVVSGQALTPFSNISGVATFGVALWFNNADAGPFTITITAFADEEAEETDPDIASVKLLMDMQGADNGTTFTDLSSAAHTIVRDGTITDTAQFKFGTSSALFDGSNDWLSVTAGMTDFDQGAAFTHEGWFMFNSTAGDQVLFTNGANPGVGGSFLRYSGGSLDWFNWDTTGHFSNAWSPSTLTWYHIAICRAGGTTRMFINGVAGATTSAVSQAQTGQSFYAIGAQGVTARPFNGWCGAYRWTKGVGRYSGNFTPPIEMFPDS